LVSFSHLIGADDRGGWAGRCGSWSISPIPPDRSSNDSTFTPPGYAAPFGTGNRAANRLVTSVWREDGA
jgi:hypothetical protein